MADSDPMKAYYRRQAERTAARRRGKLPRTPKTRRPKELERQYYAQLRGVVRLAKEAVDTYLLPVLPRVVAENRIDSMGDARTLASRYDDMAFYIKQAMEQIDVFYKRRFTKEEATRIATSMAQRGRNFTADQIQKQAIAVLGVQSISTSPRIEQEVRLAVAENVDLITSISSKYFADVQQQVFEHVRRGDNVQDLTEALTERYDIADNRAALIARDQTSKLNGVLTEIEHTNLGITSYIWRTAGDSRVRDSHVDREGQEYDYNDPPEDGNPGIAIECRCFAEPNFKGLLPDVEED